MQSVNASSFEHPQLITKCDTTMETTWAVLFNGTTQNLGNGLIWGLILTWEVFKRHLLQQFKPGSLNLYIVLTEIKPIKNCLTSEESYNKI